MKCSECKWCVVIYRSNGNRWSWGRKRYFCKHPEVSEPDRRSNHMKAFIAFGINSAESPIDIRTAPRWCPLKQNDDLQHPEP